MSYERCQEHGLIRCAMCAPKTAHSAIPDHLPEAPEVSHGWSPEDELDRGNTATVVNTAVVEEQKPDAQALEAIERQKEIQRAREGGAAADLAAEHPVFARVVEPIQGPPADHVPGTIPTREVTREELETMYAKNASVFSKDPPFQLSRTEEKPIVKAAREFEEAQAYVLVARENLETYTKQIQDAKIEWERAIDVRDGKYEALKKLVAEGEYRDRSNS